MLPPSLRQAVFGLLFKGIVSVLWPAACRRTESAPAAFFSVDDRAFPVAGSRLWNSLPTDVTSAITLPVFCSRLRTYLFSVSFPA